MRLEIVIAIIFCYRNFHAYNSSVRNGQIPFVDQFDGEGSVGYLGEGFRTACSKAKVAQVSNSSMMEGRRVSHSAIQALIKFYSFKYLANHTRLTSPLFTTFSIQYKIN